MDETKTITLSDWKDLMPPIFARCVAGRSYFSSKGYDLSRPFVVGDHVYATDGRIAVRMPTPEGWAIPNAEKIVASVPTVFGAEHRPQPVEIPEVEGDCLICDGAKQLPDRTCRACGGMGGDDVAMECDCPHCTGFHTCEDCLGTGKLPAGNCEGCDGSGVGDHRDRHKVVDGYWIGRGFAALLREHGAVAYLPETLDHHHNLRFTVGDVEGILCPTTPPSKDEWR